MMVYGFPQMGVPVKGWFVRDNPIKMDLEVALFQFQETPYGNQPGLVNRHSFIGMQWVFFFSPSQNWMNRWFPVIPWEIPSNG